MKRLQLLWPMLPGAFVLMTFGTSYLAGRIAGPERRAQCYLALMRSWQAHWPFAVGKYMPFALYPTVEPPAEVWVQVEPHMKMLLDPADFVSRMILETGEWEPGSQALVAQHLQPGATFIDVGAHIGYYSLKAAPIVGPAGHVLAIEPNPKTLRFLEGNIRASGAGTVRVWPVACSDTPGVLELFAAAEANTGDSSLSRDNAAQAGKGVAAYKVRAVPLDQIVEESHLTRVDAIKIDVEGAEFLVLKGAQKTLDRYHPAILVELMEHQLKSMGSSIAEVTSFLKAHGYSWRRTDSANVEFVADSRTSSVSGQ